MGLDDFRLLPGCPIRNERFCDFESEDICNYNNSATNDFNWSRSSKAQLGSGPSTDQ